MPPRVRVYHARARAISQEAAARLVTQMLYEVHAGAVARVSYGPYTTGALALSLKREGPTVLPGRVTGRVGSNLPYAAAVHDGAARHRIRPIPPKKRLRFYWRKLGKVVRPVSVRHPGQKGKQYLVEPLIQAARRHNFRVVVYDL